MSGMSDPGACETGLRAVRELRELVCTHVCARGLDGSSCRLTRSAVVGKAHLARQSQHQAFAGFEWGLSGGGGGRACLFCPGSDSLLVWLPFLFGLYSGTCEELTATRARARASGVEPPLPSIPAGGQGGRSRACVEMPEDTGHFPAGDGTALVWAGSQRGGETSPERQGPTKRFIARAHVGKAL